MAFAVLATITATKIHDVIVDQEKSMDKRAGLHYIDFQTTKR
jgi:hypothetical protein